MKRSKLVKEFSMVFVLTGVLAVTIPFIRAYQSLKRIVRL